MARAAVVKASSAGAAPCYAMSRGTCRTTPPPIAVRPTFRARRAAKPSGSAHGFGCCACPERRWPIPIDTPTSCPPLLSMAARRSTRMGAHAPRSPSWSRICTTRGRPCAGPAELRRPCARHLLCVQRHRHGGRCQRRSDPVWALGFATTGGPRTHAHSAGRRRRERRVALKMSFLLGGSAADPACTPVLEEIFVPAAPL